MAENFYTMLTITGKNKLSNSVALGSKINFKTLKVGDGKGTYYEPSENQTSLVNTVWTGNITSISIDKNNSNWVIVETVIPAADGGFFIREAGIFDDAGDLIAISKLAETYKPVVSEGSTKDLVIKIVLEVLNVNSVSLKIDPNVVVATKNDIQVLESKFQDISAQLTNLANEVSNSTTITPTIAYGMNNVIKTTGKNSVSPKFSIQGKTVVNLLGKVGNSEDVSKWIIFQCTTALDTVNKVFGNSGIRVTITAPSGNDYIDIGSLINKTKYYCVSGYVKNLNGTKSVLGFFNGAIIQPDSCVVTDTTAFKRVWYKLKPSDFGTTYNQITRCVYGAATNSGVFDGIMLEEITASQYNDSNFQPSPYVDSYSCLQNPYIEVRHDNLVRNGNGKEGLAWWMQQGTPNPCIENGYFKFTDDDENVNEGLYQYIYVKPGNTYSGRAVIKADTCNAKFTILEVDDYGNHLQETRKDYITSNTTDTVATLTITVSHNINKLGVFILCDGGTGTAYFKEVSLVEGTTPPTQYLPCRIEKCVLETKLTSDDFIVYDNGEVTGSLLWKHRTLFGKDYDWGCNADFTGFKRLQMTAFITNVSNSMVDNLVKFNGDMMSNVSACNGLNQFANNGTGTYINVADSETGWSETLNPNSDEVKAFMNGWKATSVNSTAGRYVFWQSVVDNSIPSVVPQTTVATAYVASSGSLVVADGTKFAVGEWILVLSSTLTGQYVLTQIGAISGNTLTIGNYAAAIPVGAVVARTDSGTSDLRVLSYCKNNIAPNYEGYQIHYKLANPEPVTDTNCHIHGDIPKFDVGENYLYLDSGMVVGEITNPTSSDGNYYRINDTYGNLYTNLLKNKVENFIAEYKNLIYDSAWSQAFGASTVYGKVSLYKTTANFDTNATYTVDYRILATIAPQIGTIGCSYSQDVVTALNKVQEEINNRQEHNSILDTIVDLSLYEQKNISWFICPWYAASGSLWITVIVPMTIKKSIPIITLSNLLIYTGSNGNVDITSKFAVYSIQYSNGVLRVMYYTSDSTTISNIKSYGVEIANLSIIADCRGRI